MVALLLDAGPSIGLGTELSNSRPIPTRHQGLRLRQTGGYFSEVLIEVNFVLRLLPRPLTATIIAMEIPAAIRPYSMAVAPDSLAKNLAKICLTFASA
jgi:hypothetical protein